MNDEIKGEGLVERAKLISAVREYEMEKTRRKEKRVNFTVSLPESDDRILIRVITEPEAKSGYVGVDTVKEMSQTLSKRHYDKGILISQRFTEAAKREMKHVDIEAVSCIHRPSKNRDNNALHSTSRDIIQGKNRRVHSQGCQQARGDKAATRSWL